MKYIAVIGDIKNSKDIGDRYDAQERLNSILEAINCTYERDIASGFLITLGDEFQGLLCHVDHLTAILDRIEQSMAPVKIRFGIGVGEILTPIHPDYAIGADGPAYYAARNMIDRIKKEEGRHKEKTAGCAISIYDDPDNSMAEIANTLMMLLSALKRGWSSRQQKTIWDMENIGGTQAECADRLGTSQSSVARMLSNGNYYTYLHAKDTLQQVFKMIEEA